MLLTLLGAPGALRHMQPEKLLTSPAAQTATAPRGRKEPANSGSTHTTGDVVNSLFFFFYYFYLFFYLAVLHLGCSRRGICLQHANSQL